MNDLASKLELAREADDILKSKAFAVASADMKARFLNMALSQTASQQNKLDLLMKISLVDEFAAEFKILINAYKVKARNG